MSIKNPQSRKDPIISAITRGSGILNKMIIPGISKYLYDSIPLYMPGTEPSMTVAPVVFA